MWLTQEKSGLPGKFVLAEWKNFATDLSYYATTVLRPAVFQYVLHNVVAILVMQQSLGVLVHLFQ